MKTTEEQIIAKQDEYIAYLKNQCRLTSLSVERYESELSALKAQAEQVTDETLDLQQYVTNLLYYAHVEAMDMHSIDFDKWVEREVNNIAEYLNIPKTNCHAEEIFKKHYKKASGKDADEMTLHHMKYVIDAMQEYAAQFKQEKVTDEDIKKEALRRFTSNTGWIDHEKIDGFKRGAKAMRDGLIQYKKD